MTSYTDSNNIRYTIFEQNSRPPNQRPKKKWRALDEGREQTQRRRNPNNQDGSAPEYGYVQEPFPWLWAESEGAIHLTTKPIIRRSIVVHAHIPANTPFYIDYDVDVGDSFQGVVTHLHWLGSSKVSVNNVSRASTARHCYAVIYITK